MTVDEAKGQVLRQADEISRGILQKIGPDVDGQSAEIVAFALLTILVSTLGAAEIVDWKRFTHGIIQGQFLAQAGIKLQEKVTGLGSQLLLEATGRVLAEMALKDATTEH